MLKIYTLIHDFSLSTPLEVGGETVAIIFSGGCKALAQNGEYSTTDQQVQQAIENSSGYGRVYILRKSFPLAGEETATVPVAGVEDGDSGLQPKSCVTVNEAIEWLTTLGCRKCDINTSVKAVDTAKKLGYNLTLGKKA